MKQEPVCRETVTVVQEEGLHLRPLSLIAETARRFDSDVRIHNGDRSADAKNVLDLMTLSAGRGTELLLETRGSDARPALDAVLRLFHTDFVEVNDEEGDE